MNSTSDRCRRWWPPQDWADGECGPAAPSLRPKPNAPPELDLASLLHECFVPLDDLVPSCPVPPAAGTQVIASTTDEDHHQGTSERDTSFEGGGDVYDVKDTYNLVSSVLKMYCGDGIRAGEFFLGLLKVGFHINLTGDVLNILENGRKQKKGHLHQSTKSKSFQKAMVSGSKHVARLLSASRFQQAARDAKELPIALAETETGTQPGDQERGMMRAHYLARCAANEAASAASARGEERSASIHATVARYHGRAVYRCRQAASLEAYFQNNSTILNLYKLDLHGLHVADALEILKYHIIYLHSLEHPGSWLMKVVTGVGHHSEDGVAKVQPAVIDYLADAGYVFDVEDMNPGIVRILLERRERDAVLEFASLS